jgi:hypothetical protein
VCTSVTRPGTPFEGQAIYETDTDLVYICTNATGPVWTLSAALPTAWTAVTFTNSWVNYGGAFQTCQYRKVGDTVQLRGLCKSGTAGTSMFTLPAGFRPPASINFTAESNAVFATITITTTGTVVCAGGTNANVSIALQFSVTA